MTKSTPDDTALKYHLTLEEPKKLVEENALAVCSLQTDPDLRSELKVTSIATDIKPKKTSLEKIFPKLHNLEDSDESEIPVKIDLDLYQMEDV